MELHTTESELELEAEARAIIMESSNKNAYASVGYTEEYHGPARLPTFKEYGDKIRTLEHENFQLKVRIHLHDTKYGRSVPGSGGQENTFSAATLELAREFHLLKETKEVLQKKVQDLENENKKQTCELLALEDSREASLQVRDIENRYKEQTRELQLLKQSKEELERRFQSLERENKNQAIELELLKDSKETLQNKVKVFENQYNFPDPNEFELLKDSNDALQQSVRDLQNEFKVQEECFEDKVTEMTEALKTMGYRLHDEKLQHNHLRSKYEALMEKFVKTSADLEQIKQEFEDLATRGEGDVQRGVDGTSPDLGIESGHDVPFLNENILKVSNIDNSEEKIRALKALNKDLATKLRHTKLALDKTLERLSKTTQDKEHVEKAVCRQLHRTHGILRAARKNLEDPHAPAVPLTQIE